MVLGQEIKQKLIVGLLLTAGSKPRWYSTYLLIKIESKINIG